MPRRWVLVSGGVLSGLGKGVVSASIGKLLQDKRVVTIKCDGYLNIDPGTMNPFEHGEVFVLDDGGEVDMDFGHYERFLPIKAKRDWNLTSGKIFQTIIEKERRGDFLGKTVQIIPHVTDEIKQRWRNIFDREKAEVGIIEIGGTVGDIENLVFFEAARQMRLEGEQMVAVHLTYVPILDSVGEQKTKPTQQSVVLMLERGIQPDFVVCRSRDPLSDNARHKVALFSNISVENVISNPDIQTVYELPLVFQKQRFDILLREKLGIKGRIELGAWKKLVDNILKPKTKVRIAICGKYTALKDSYISIKEALVHAGAHLGVMPEITLIETTEPAGIDSKLKGFDGLIIPGGFGNRGCEGKIGAIQYAREHSMPFLGLCLGMQLAVIEFARNKCNLKDANSTEFSAKTKHPVVFLLPTQRGVKTKGATMRLGGQTVAIKQGTKAADIFKSKTISRRFRHRYEVNPKYVPLLQEKGLVFSGMTPSGDIMQLMELPGHPFFMASQFHPEFTSKLEQPDGLFVELLKAAAKHLKVDSR